MNWYYYNLLLIWAGMSSDIIIKPFLFVSWTCPLVLRWGVIRHENCWLWPLLNSSNREGIQSSSDSQNYQHQWVVVGPIADRGRVGGWNDLHTAIKSRSCFVPPAARRCSAAVFEMSRPPDNMVSTVKTQGNRRRRSFAVTRYLVCACVVGFCRWASLYAHLYAFN